MDKMGKPDSSFLQAARLRRVEAGISRDRLFITHDKFSYLGGGEGGSGGDKIKTEVGNTEAVYDIVGGKIVTT